MHLVDSPYGLDDARSIAETLSPTLIIAPGTVRGRSIHSFVQGIRSLGSPSSKFLIISGHIEQQSILTLAAIGIEGHLLWDSASVETVQRAAILIAKHDVRLASEELIHELVGRPAQSHELALTERDLLILYLLSQGHTQEGVAQQVSISRRTVERAIANLQIRLDAPSMFSLGWKAGVLGLAIDNTAPANDEDRGPLKGVVAFPPKYWRNLR